MKKILIKAYINGNLGDDLFIIILAKRYPNTKFELLGSNKYKRNFIGLKNVNYISNNFCVKILKRLFLLFPRSLSLRYSGVIEIGGSIFQQITKSNSVSKRRVILAKNLPYYILGSNFGPYNNEAFLYNYRTFFKKVNGIVFRDEESYSLFDKYGNVMLAPDLVLSLNTSMKHVKINNRKVIICPINLDSKRFGNNDLKLETKDYERRLANIITKFQKKGFSVEMLSFCDGEQDDTAIIRILNQLSDDERSDVIFKRNVGLNYKLKTFETAEYVVGSRFHSMILSWKFQKKSLIISYNKKIDNTVKYLFPEQYYMSVTEFNNKDDFDLKKFIKIPLDVLRNIESESEKQFYYVDKFLDRKDTFTNE